MKRLNTFLKATVIGGTVVILPVAILLIIFRWIYYFITDLIQPLSNMIVKKSFLPEITADLIVIAIILFLCFFVGMLVKTKLGQLLYRGIENRLLKAAPGYSLIKETIVQVMGQKESPFSSVALARIFGNDTLATCFITDRHSDGSFTVFMPTGPNPTSGLIFHLKREYVHPVSVPVEDVIRSIISCGSGSARVFNAYVSSMK
ncbi:MAG: DUF502 domain-containing protein [Deltaproteobacteria bacterium]|nr:DUF502 domain-containing protein [Deltaproteobacteria bacterium]